MQTISKIFSVQSLNGTNFGLHLYHLLCLQLSFFSVVFILFGPRAANDGPDKTRAETETNRWRGRRRGAETETGKTVRFIDAWLSMVSQDTQNRDTIYRGYYWAVDSPGYISFIVITFIVMDRQTGVDTLQSHLFLSVLSCHILSAKKASACSMLIHIHILSQALILAAMLLLFRVIILPHFLALWILCLTLVLLQLFPWQTYRFAFVSSWKLSET